MPPKTSNTTLLSVKDANNTGRCAGDLHGTETGNPPSPERDVSEDLRVVCNLYQALDAEIAKVRKAKGKKVPDFQVCTSLAQQLFEMKSYNFVVSATWGFVHALSRQNCDFDESESAAVKQLMHIVADALEASSISESDKLLWAIGECRVDRLGFAEPYETFLKKKHAKDAWFVVAQLLCDAPPPDVWTRFAIESCGESADKARQVCTARCINNHDYETPVRFLLDDGKAAEALAMVEEGLKARCCHTQPVTLYTLKSESLAAMGDHEGELLARAEAFVYSPTAETYNACMACAGTALASKIRECLAGYLEKGRLPWECWEWPTDKKTSWVRGQGRFPDWPTLWGIAEDSLDPELICRVYPKLDLALWNPTAAEAVVDSHPDIAVRIWKHFVRMTLLKKRRKDYADAFTSLTRLKDVLPFEEWSAFVIDLQQHVTFPRLFKPLLPSTAGTGKNKACPPVLTTPGRGRGRKKHEDQ